MDPLVSFDIYAFEKFKNSKEGEKGKLYMDHSIVQ